MASAVISLQLSASSQPIYIPARIHSHVPATPAQMGHGRMPNVRRAPHTSPVKNQMDNDAIMISIELQKENNHAKSDHRCSSAEPHGLTVCAMQYLCLIQKGLIACGKQNERKRQDKNHVVEKEIAHAAYIRRLIMQKSQHHQVWPARAGKFAEPHKPAEQKCGGHRCLSHQICHFMMCKTGNFQLHRESGKKFVDEVYDSKRNEQYGPHPPHE